MCSGYRTLIPTAIMNMVIGPSGRELLDNEVLPKSSRETLQPGGQKWQVEREECVQEQRWSLQ